MLGHVQAESVELNQNIDHLRAHLVRLDTILRMAVARAKAVGFTLDDEFQGLYIDEAEIQQHLETTPGTGLWDHGVVDLAAWQQVERAQYAEIMAMEQSAPADHNYRLLRLAEAFNLSPVERDYFLFALAPELDRRYERIYAFIQDDVVKRRPTVDLALNLLGNTFGERLAAWSIFGPESALIRHDLVIVYPDPSQREPSLLSHFLRVDARVVNFVLGYDFPDARLMNAVDRISATRQNGPRLDEMIVSDTRREQLRGSVGSNPIYYFYGTYGAALKETALALADWAGISLVTADLVRLKAQSTDGALGGMSFERLVRLAFRDARLWNAALYLDGWASVLDDRQAAPPWLIQLIIEYPHLIFLGGTENWEPHATDRDRPIFRVEFPVPEYDERLRYWETHVYGVKDYSADLNLAELADKFRLMPGQIRDAVRTGRDIAAWKNGGLLTMTELYAGSRAQSNRKLSNLAQKIVPKYSWDDIVLPDDRVQQLREMCNQVQYGHHVYDDWGFGGKLANAEGITALFAGQSGTGKTMSAEIMAAALGLELYKIDLSTVVSKYIGETEKNLSAIFNEAAQSNAILFFDEADALFGKRSEVKDSHDRYANIEIGYLLQRMETYDGITILATNLRQNLDEAFTRRIDFLVDFPFPEEMDRLKIWKVTFPKTAPIADDVDLMSIARRFRMAGGNIRNAVLASAFLAAADGEPKIKQQHLIHAIRREHQKMGKLLEEEPVNGFDYEEEAFEDFEEG